MIGSLEKNGSLRNIARTRQGKRLETIPALELLGPSRSQRSSQDPRVFQSGRDFAGLDRDRAAARFDRRQTEARADLETGRPITSGAFSLSELMPSYGVRASSLRSILGLTQLLARRPFKVVAVALANKMVRIAWALLGQGRGP